MAHSHHPSHHIGNRTILSYSLAIISGYMLIEFVAGYVVNSLALLADAGHMANDAFSLLLALIALSLHSTGQKWVALLNGGSLLVVAIGILLEALSRWQQPIGVMPLPMLIVAVIGLAVNGGVLILMHKSDRHNLNIRAAYLHILADLLGSVSAIIAGLSIWLFGWLWVDLAAAVLLSLFIFLSGGKMLLRLMAEWKNNEKPKMH